MKKLILSCFFIGLAIIARGQLKDTVVKRDTINIRGIVYGYDGKPLKNIELALSENKPITPGYPFSAKTDDQGYFEIKGANPDDYIHFVNFLYHFAYFPLKGSRYLVLYLPKPDVIEPLPSDSVVVKAIRTQPKKIASLKIEIRTDRYFDDPFEVHPYFVGGFQSFFKILNQRIVYPKAAVENNIEGIVEISFQIGTDNSLKDFKVLRGIGYGCEEEVIKQIKNAGKWRIGIIKNKFYSVEQIVKVQFKLTDK